MSAFDGWLLRLTLCTFVLDWLELNTWRSSLCGGHGSWRDHLGQEHKERPWRRWTINSDTNWIYLLTQVAWKQGYNLNLYEPIPDEVNIRSSPRTCSQTLTCYCDYKTVASHNPRFQVCHRDSLQSNNLVTRCLVCTTSGLHKLHKPCFRMGVRWGWACRKNHIWGLATPRHLIPPRLLGTFHLPAPP